MEVPDYYRSRAGRVFRLERRSENLGMQEVAYLLRAVPLAAQSSSAAPAVHEARAVLSKDLLREKMRNRQAIPTPEHVFERLWQQVRLRLDDV